MNRSNKHRRKQQGFTIIELMIATTVLSVILVMVTFVMISIGKLYYKGISQAKAQQTARSIVEDVSDRLELNDKNPYDPPPTHPPTDATLTFQAYCVGETRYSYILNRQIGSDAATQIRHVLWRDKTPASGCVPADLTLANPTSDPSDTSGTELMTDRGQLAAFSVSGTSPYQIEVLVALGEDDTLDKAGSNTQCKNQANNEFCATSRLITSVTKRLPGS